MDECEAKMRMLSQNEIMLLMKSGRLGETYLEGRMSLFDHAELDLGRIN